MANDKVYTESEAPAMTVGKQRKEKWLAIAVALLSICVLALLIAVIVLAVQRQNTKESEKPCIEEHCIRAALNIMDNVDKEVKPCDDFWKHSCGNFIKTHPVFEFENKTTYSNPLILNARVTNRLIGALIEKNTNDTISPVKKVRQFFTTCLKAKINPEVEIKAFVRRVTNFGGIPFVTGDMNVNITYEDFLVQFQKYFAPNQQLIQMQINKNFISGKGPLVFVSIGRVNDAKSIVSVIKNITKALNQSVTTYDETEITDFVEAFRELAAAAPVTLDYIQKQSAQNISELSKVLPDFEIKNYINGILSSVGGKLKNDSEICVLYKDIVMNATRLISNTSLQSIANIMAASLVLTYQGLAPAATMHNKVHSEHLNSESTRYATCLKYTTIYAPRVLGRMYVRKYFTEKDLEKAKEICKYLGKALITVFTENTWLDSDSKRAILKKAKRLVETASIGYNANLISDTFLNKRFENINITDDFVSNILELDKATYRKNWLQFVEGFGKDAFVMKSVEVNAEYSPFHNHISVSAAILQPPIFGEGIPAAISFGSIGSIFGHEMMHAFDSNGVKFDSSGVRVTILSNSSEQEYNKRKDELIKEYSNFKMASVNKTVDGLQTISENIADLSGVKIAYMAYKLWRKDHSEVSIPIDMNKDRIFFNAYSQFWCKTLSNDNLEEQLKTDLHAPAQSRVTITLRNSADFADAFYCPDNASMNPKEKIEIW